MWLQSKKDCYSVVRTAAGCFRDKVGIFNERIWPIVCCGCAILGKLLFILFRYWKDCLVRGCKSFFALGSAALLLIMWSCFLSLTSLSCLVYVLLSMVWFYSISFNFLYGLWLSKICFLFINWWLTSLILDLLHMHCTSKTYNDISNKNLNISTSLLILPKAHWSSWTWIECCSCALVSFAG